jgi:hypothetical protein
VSIDLIRHGGCTLCIASSALTYPSHLDLLSITHNIFFYNFSVRQYFSQFTKFIYICISLLYIFSMVSPSSNLKFSNLILSTIVLVFFIFKFPSYLIIRAFHIPFVFVVLLNKRTTPHLPSLEWYLQHYYFLFLQLETRF